jgi:electron transfer flavoprotein beta subunit
VHIAVLVKQVPDSEAAVQVKADGSGVEIEDRYTLNFFDSLAVEEALRIKEQGGDSLVTLITLGEQKAVEALRTGLAMGADHAVLLEDPAFAGGDEYATATALAAALKGMSVDLVLCGKEAFDDSSGVVGPLVAEFLGIPHVTSVVKLDLSADKQSALIEREIESGKEMLKVPLPVLLSAQKGLNEARVPPVMGVMKAMRAEIKKLNLAALGLPAAVVGKAGSKEEILRYHRRPQRPTVTMLQGEALDIVRRLVRLLKEGAKVI